VVIRCGDLDRLHCLMHCVGGESLDKEEGFIFALYTLVRSARECRAKTVHHCFFGILQHIPVKTTLTSG